MARSAGRACFRTPIAIRAYTEDPERLPLGAKPPRADLAPSYWTLVIDTETTTDATQQLRVGFYQVRCSGKPHQEGVFYNPQTITAQEEALLRDFAGAHKLQLLPLANFITQIFFKYGYTRHGTIVGFNLPFDLSRIAIGHQAARRGMRGGFTFQLSRNAYYPRVRIKHLSSRSALIDFARPAEQKASRGMQKRGLKVPAYRGHFADVKTAAASILSQRFSLESLALYLNTPTQKRKTEEHGTITTAYLDYARTDVQVTWECYEELSRRYHEHGLTRPIDRLLSEASIGKAYLQEMGVQPFMYCDPAFPREALGAILSAYYGGRAEVRIRREVREVLYCDFKSMYPTVNSLMGLWQFVIAQGMTMHDTTSGTQSFLEAITLEDLQRPATWKKLPTLVRLRPQEDVLPARAKYDGKSYTIGLNHLTAPEPVWYTLADCIVSKLLTGRCPRIDRAVTYEPGPPQKELKPTKILGLQEFTIDPTTEDFFKRLVDLRDQQAEGNPAKKVLKIIANSTSYGIFIEVIRDDAPKAEPLSVYGPNGEEIERATKAVEEPGRYFHPLLGVLITGAARLMLGIAEKLTLDRGLDWAFCDTDSLAIARPQSMARREFHRRAWEVIDWFAPLNPYTKPGSILKVEDHNYTIGSKKRQPLYCWAISAKRYALFNRAGNKIILRKASAHGLGHLLDPYPESQAPADIPPPAVPLKEIGVHRWQYDLWYQIISAAVHGDPDSVPLDWHPAFQNPAAMRYTASSPHLLRWVDPWNRGRPYEEQIRPFNFLLAFMPRTGPFTAPTETLTGDARRGRPSKANDIAPIAPYDRDPARALSKVFDRVTGKPISPEQLKTYAEVLAQYHLSSEDKFENGQFLDRGRTERRHVVATGFVWIGKEANRVGESGEGDPIWSAVEEFRRGGMRSSRSGRC